MTRGAQAAVIESPAGRVFVQRQGRGKGGASRSPAKKTGGGGGAARAATPRAGAAAGAPAKSGRGAAAGPRSRGARNATKAPRAKSGRGAAAGPRRGRAPAKEGRPSGAKGAARQRPGRPARLPIRTEIIDHLCTDPKLEAAVREVGEYDIRLDSDKYESLVQAIITQQLSSKASGAITARLKALYGGAFPAPADILATSDEDLRGVGLSRSKVSYIRGISELVESGGLDLDSLEKMPDDEVVAVLTAVKGVGRWTAEMFLIFTLGRLDVLPVDDLGLRKGIKMAYSTRTLPTGAEATRIAERWRPYRTVATWYLWKFQRLFDRV